MEFSALKARCRKLKGFGKGQKKTPHKRGFRLLVVPQLEDEEFILRRYKDRCDLEALGEQHTVVGYIVVTVRIVSEDVKT